MTSLKVYQQMERKQQQQQQAFVKISSQSNHGISTSLAKFVPAAQMSFKG